MFMQAAGRAAACCGHTACAIPRSQVAWQMWRFCSLQFAEAIVQQLHELAGAPALGGAADIQVALWLRLALLGPLLPLVYASKEGVAGGSLRARLAPILLR
jgi:hypothetical protein